MGITEKNRARRQKRIHSVEELAGASENSAVGVCVLEELLEEAGVVGGERAGDSGRQ